MSFAYRKVFLEANSGEAPGVSAASTDPPFLEGPPKKSGQRGRCV